MVRSVNTSTKYSSTTQLTSGTRLPDLDDVVGAEVFFGCKESIAAMQAEIVSSIEKSNGSRRFLQSSETS